MHDVAPTASCADCGRCPRATAHPAAPPAAPCLARLRLAVLSPLAQPHLLGHGPGAAPAPQASGPAAPHGPDYLQP